MKRDDVRYFCLFNITWFILLLEHWVFHLELALPFAIGWGIVSMISNIRILAKYAIRIYK